MTDTYLILNKLTFGYEQSLKNPINTLTVHFATGWTGIVGPNGSGKSTLMLLAAGELQPVEGTIEASGEVVYCPQRTDHPPDMFDTFMSAYDKISMRLIGILGIQDDWISRWHSLSYGERKRVQIAVALWREPDVLLLDEPTNHLDRQSADVLLSALRSFRGTGLLVSHDRTLLDALCYQCVYFEQEGVVLRPGNYSQGREQQEHEYESSVKLYREAEQAHRKIQREVARRRNAADNADRQRSKRQIGTKDHDAKAKIDLARVSGKDGAAGRRLRQLQGRVAQSEQHVESLAVRGRRVTGVQMEGERSKRDRLLSIGPDELPLGSDRMLYIPEISMKPGDTIALVGRNGSGKSTFIRYVLEHLSIPRQSVTYIPQEIDAARSKVILDDVRALPNEMLGKMFIIVSRLGSEPKHLLETTMPSSGEIRKLVLAYGILQNPHLIIMDEPTNHMDLASIECIEDALKQCSCGLLLVSHDTRFLSAVTEQTWKIEAGGDEDGIQTLAEAVF